MKHTKGEWKVHSIANGIQPHAVKVGEHSICDIPTDIDSPITLKEEQANAKLIAAAPTMLETLISTRSQLIDGGFSETSVTVIAIDLAIKAATE